MSVSWFDVDKAGLAKLVERRGYAFTLYELVSNAWDEKGVKNVQIDFIPEERQLIVGDDAPGGFADLSHAWTLFAASRKAGNDKQRGRFNLGEKLVLALCERADIVSTDGAVRFDSDGRHRMKERTATGSLIRLTFKRLTKANAVEIELAARMLIVPEGVSTRFNGVALSRPARIASTTATLPCEIADGDGVLRRSLRTTVIHIHEPTSGPGFGWVYEHGIPIVHTDDRYSYDIHGKVPLTLERDNVTPSFLRKVRAAALNVTAESLTPEDGSASWVREATSAPEIDAEAYTKALDLRFGQDRVMTDPSDREATHRAALADATVVHGNQLSEGERENLRRFRAEGVDPIVPAGKSGHALPKSSVGRIIPMTEWSVRESMLAHYAHVLGTVLLGIYISVQWGETCAFDATYGRGVLTLYQGGGEGWRIDKSLVGLEDFHALLLHEFSHHFESSHEGRNFAEAGFKLGAKLATLLITGKLVPTTFGWEVK